MDAITNLTPMSRLVSLLLTVAGLVGLYYLYQYLFASTTGNTYLLISKNQPANPKEAIQVNSDNLPRLYEGGEFTISTWIYVNDWTWRQGKNKSILSIEGDNFDIIRIYLDKYKPTLKIRLHSNEIDPIPGSGTVAGSVAGAGTGGLGSGTGGLGSGSLKADTRTTTFGNNTASQAFEDTLQICDLPEFELQRWVCITVAVNGKTVDVYYDGRLARSCVLPNYYKVDTRYTARLLGYDGFGGQISRTTMYDIALNPEQVYKIYMAGPEPITDIGSWLSSFLLPGVNISITQTK
jgi:hypothetical protein